MLEELILTAERLCKNLEIAADNERKFTTDICLELERYSWQMCRMANDIKQIKDYVG